MSNIFEYNNLSYPVRHIHLVTYVTKLPVKEGYSHPWVFEFFVNGKEIELSFETELEAEKIRKEILKLIKEEK